MTNPYFSEIESWHIPEMVIAEALAEMAIDGREGNEGIALFLGRDDDGAAEVTHLVKLRGVGLEKYPDQINIHSSLLNEVTDVAVSSGVRLVGQVHSHGPGYGVGLSYTDRTYGVQTPYYLSLVAPDYALSAAPLQRWGVHVFMENQGYVRLRATEAGRRLRVIPGVHVPVITVGVEDGR
jgi:proteasome lid subunit RPN8/RPN11